MSDDLFIDVDVQAIENLDSSTAKSLLDKTNAITETINLVYKQYTLGIITIAQYLELRNSLVQGLKETINRSLS